MARRKDKKKLVFGPIIVLGLMTLLIMVVSFIFSLIGFEGQKASLINETLEMSLTTVKNIFSVDGFRYMIGSVVTNFRLLEPLVLMIMSLIAMSVLETSGLMHYYASKLKKVKPSVLTFLVVIIGILSNFLGDYAYVLLLPLVASIYKYMGRNPMSGILTVFLGITLGYGAGIFINYNTYIMGNLTELVATTQVDKNYKFGIFSNLYIMIATTGLISLLLTYILNKNFTDKLPKQISEEIEEVNISKKAYIISNIVLVIMILLTIYMIIPGLPFSGILLDMNGTNYIDMLFSPSSASRDGIIYMIILMLMIYGAIYGKISKNISSFIDYNTGLAKGFENVGYVFVIMFFSSVMMGILNWTNMSEVIVAKLSSFLGYIPFSGIPLISFFFVLVVIMTIIMPDTLTKWQFIAPLVVPLFMRANITPDFTQFIFTVADGMGKAITPIFVYFIIMLGFLQKYNKNEKPITIFGVIKLILPKVLLVMVLVLLFIVIWYIASFPLGLGSVTTL